MSSLEERREARRRRRAAAEDDVVGTRSKSEISYMVDARLQQRRLERQQRRHKEETLSVNGGEDDLERRRRERREARLRGDAPAEEETSQRSRRHEDDAPAEEMSSARARRRRDREEEEEPTPASTEEESAPEAPAAAEEDDSAEREAERRRQEQEQEEKRRQEEEIRRKQDEERRRKEEQRKEEERKRKHTQQSGLTLRISTSPPPGTRQQRGLGQENGVQGQPFQRHTSGHNLDRGQGHAWGQAQTESHQSSQSSLPRGEGQTGGQGLTEPGGSLSQKSASNPLPANYSLPGYSPLPAQSPLPGYSPLPCSNRSLLSDCVFNYTSDASISDLALENQRMLEISSDCDLGSSFDDYAFSDQDTSFPNMIPPAAFSNRRRPHNTRGISPLALAAPLRPTDKHDRLEGGSDGGGGDDDDGGGGGDCAPQAEDSSSDDDHFVPLSRESGGTMVEGDQASRDLLTYRTLKRRPGHPSLDRTPSTDSSPRKLHKCDSVSSCELSLSFSRLDGEGVDTTRTASPGKQQESVSPGKQRDSASTGKQRESVSAEKQWESDSAEKQWESVSAEKQWESVSAEKQWESVSAEIQQECVSPSKQEDSASPGKQWETISTGKQWKSVSPRKQQESVSPRKQQDLVSPGKQWETASTGKQWKSVSPRKQQESVSPRKQQDSASPGKQWETASTGKQWKSVSPRKQQESVSPRKQQDSASPGKQWETASTGKQWKSVSPRKQQDLVSPEKEWETASPGKQWESVSPGKQWKSVSPGKHWEPTSPRKPWESVSPRKQWESVSPRIYQEAAAASPVKTQNDVEQDIKRRTSLTGFSPRKPPEPAEHEPKRGTPDIKLNSGRDTPLSDGADSSFEYVPPTTFTTTTTTSASPVAGKSFTISNTRPFHSPVHARLFKRSDPQRSLSSPVDTGAASLAAAHRSSPSPVSGSSSSMSHTSAGRHHDISSRMSELQRQLQAKLPRSDVTSAHKMPHPDISTASRSRGQDDVKASHSHARSQICDLIGQLSNRLKAREGGDCDSRSREKAPSPFGGNHEPRRHSVPEQRLVTSPYMIPVHRHRTSLTDDSLMEEGENCDYEDGDVSANDDDDGGDCGDLGNFRDVDKEASRLENFPGDTRFTEMDSGQPTADAEDSPPPMHDPFTTPARPKSGTPYSKGGRPDKIKEELRLCLDFLNDPAEDLDSEEEQEEAMLQNQMAMQPLTDDYLDSTCSSFYDTSPPTEYTETDDFAEDEASYAQGVSAYFSEDSFSQSHVPDFNSAWDRDRAASMPDITGREDNAFFNGLLQSAMLYPLCTPPPAGLSSPVPPLSTNTPTSTTFPFSPPPLLPETDYSGTECHSPSPPPQPSPQSPLRQPVQSFRTIPPPSPPVPPPPPPPPPVATPAGVVSLNRPAARHGDGLSATDMSTIIAQREEDLLTLLCKEILQLGRKAGRQVPPSTTSASQYSSSSTAGGGVSVEHVIRPSALKSSSGLRDWDQSDFGGGFTSLRQIHTTPAVSADSQAANVPLRKLSRSELTAAPKRKSVVAETKGGYSLLSFWQQKEGGQDVQSPPWKKPAPVKSPPSFIKTESPKPSPVGTSASLMKNSSAVEASTTSSAAEKKEAFLSTWKNVSSKTVESKHHESNVQNDTFLSSLKNSYSKTRQDVEVIPEELKAEIDAFQELSRNVSNLSKASVKTEPSSLFRGNRSSSAECSTRKVPPPTLPKSTTIKGLQLPRSFLHEKSAATMFQQAKSQLSSNSSLDSDVFVVNTPPSHSDTQPSSHYRRQLRHSSTDSALEGEQHSSFDSNRESSFRGQDSGSSVATSVSQTRLSRADSNRRSHFQHVSYSSDRQHSSKVQNVSYTTDRRQSQQLSNGHHNIHSIEAGKNEESGKKEQAGDSSSDHSPHSETLKKRNIAKPLFNARRLTHDTPGVWKCAEDAKTEYRPGAFNPGKDAGRTDQGRVDGKNTRHGHADTKYTSQHHMGNAYTSQIHTDTAYSPQGHADSTYAPESFLHSEQEQICAGQPVPEEHKTEYKSWAADYLKDRIMTTANSGNNSARGAHSQEHTHSLKAGRASNSGAIDSVKDVSKPSKTPPPVSAKPMSISERISLLNRINSPKSSTSSNPDAKPGSISDREGPDEASQLSKPSPAFRSEQEKFASLLQNKLNNIVCHDGPRDEDREKAKKRHNRKMTPAEEIARSRAWAGGAKKPPKTDTSTWSPELTSTPTTLSRASTDPQLMARFNTDVARNNTEFVRTNTESLRTNTEWSRTNTELTRTNFDLRRSSTEPQSIARTNSDLPHTNPGSMTDIAKEFDHLSYAISHEEEEEEKEKRGNRRRGSRRLSSGLSVLEMKEMFDNRESLPNSNNSTRNNSPKHMTSFSERVSDRFEPQPIAENRPVVGKDMVPLRLTGTRNSVLDIVRKVETASQDIKVPTPKRPTEHDVSLGGKTTNKLSGSFLKGEGISGDSGTATRKGKMDKSRRYTTGVNFAELQLRFSHPEHFKKNNQSRAMSAIYASSQDVSSRYHQQDVTNNASSTRSMENLRTRGDSSLDMYRTGRTRLEKSADTLLNLSKDSLYDTAMWGEDSATSLPRAESSGALECSSMRPPDIHSMNGPEFSRLSILRSPTGSSDPNVSSSSPSPSLSPSFNRSRDGCGLSAASSARLMEEEERMAAERAEQDRKQREEEERRREEEEKKKKKKRKGLGGLSPEKKKLLKKLIMQKAAEDLRNEAKAKAEEKERFINERVTPLKAEGLGQADLQNLVKELHSKVAVLEEEVYDWEIKIRKQDFEINELTLKVNDTKGKFIKPVLRKVNKTESKLTKLQTKESRDFRGNLKSTGQNKFALKEDEDTNKPDWREALKHGEGEEAES